MSWLQSRLWHLKDSPLAGLIQTALWLETIGNFLVIRNPLGYWLGRTHVHRVDLLKARWQSIPNVLVIPQLVFTTFPLSRLWPSGLGCGTILGRWQHEEGNIAGLNPGQEWILRCSCCPQKPYPVNTLVNTFSSDQSGESTFQDFKMKVTLAICKRLPTGPLHFAPACSTLCCSGSAWLLWRLGEPRAVSVQISAAKVPQEENYRKGKVY